MLWPEPVRGVPPPSARRWLTSGCQSATLWRRTARQCFYVCCQNYCCAIGTLFPDLNKNTRVLHFIIFTVFYLRIVRWFRGPAVGSHATSRPAHRIRQWRRDLSNFAGFSAVLRRWAPPNLQIRHPRRVTRSEEKKIWLKIWEKSGKPLFSK